MNLKDGNNSVDSQNISIFCHSILNNLSNEDNLSNIIPNKVKSSTLYLIIQYITS